MRRLIIGGLAALAIGLTGCGSNAAPASAPTPSSSVPTSMAAPIPMSSPPAVSTLAPNLALPIGSVDNATGVDLDDSYPQAMELWKVPPSISYDVTVNRVEAQLPVRQDYDGMAWCTKDVMPKLNLTQWSWGDARDSLVIVVAYSERDGLKVTIVRGSDERDDRSDCDVP